MNHPADFMFYIHFLFIMAFIAVLLGGVYLFKHFDRFFGADPNIPSESSSDRTYTRLQVFTVWGHALLLTGMLALLLH